MANPPMQVYYKTIFDTDGVSVYKIVSLHYSACCDVMQEAYNNGFVGFGHWRDDVMNRNTSVNLTSVNLYPGDEDFDFMPITLCPFCGAVIQTIEAERVKLVERKRRKIEVYTEEKVL